MFTLTDLHVTAIKVTIYISFSINITDLKSVILYRAYKTGKNNCKKEGGREERRRITRKTNKNVDMDWKHELQKFVHICVYSHIL
jgi:hypothetical protein